MIIGSLKEVMGLNEDGITARRRKAINNARKDPNTRVAVHFDGSDVDYYNKIKDVAKPKERKFLDEKLKKVKSDPDYDEKEASLPNSTKVAAINKKTNIYAVNDNAPDRELMKKDGTINFNSKAMNHETQHEIQNKMTSALARKNHIPEEEENRKLSAYDVTISTNKNRRYKKNPMEFEANIAGLTKNPRPRMSTYRLANQSLGLPIPKKEFIPSYTHANTMFERMDDRYPSPEERQLAKNKDNDPRDGTAVPARKSMDMQEYKTKGQKMINNIHVPTKGFDVSSLDRNKSTSKDPNINKSKNTFIKVKNEKGRTITVPK